MINVDVLEDERSLDLTRCRILKDSNIPSLPQLDSLCLRSEPLGESLKTLSLPGNALTEITGQQTSCIIFEELSLRSRMGSLKIKEIDGFRRRNGVTRDPWQDLSDEEADDGDDVVEEETLSTEWEESHARFGRGVLSGEESIRRITVSSLISTVTHRSREE
ncbi:unnamed protein product, partial [Mesorhabditis belari]|uniref:Uncharacterized protein n=1 Tax=Mesorhabditis belari TaxID=2138241 RepID=A0AAF3F9I6_9BILA